MNKNSFLLFQFFESDFSTLIANFAEKLMFYYILSKGAMSMFPMMHSIKKRGSLFTAKGNR